MAYNLSINIGLNRVDPNKYNGWDGALGGCVNDANAMRSLATKLGFSPLRLINEEATRATVIEAVSKASQKLESGDTLLITYSGHGGQVPDANGDEIDGKDETWVLYDGMMIDDEIYQLWTYFKAGVRIILISDSCHSGTVDRQLFRSEMIAHLRGFTRASEVSFQDKLIPDELAYALYESHPEIYKAAQFSALRGDRTEIAAHVILISGCQDNQLSADTGQNGLFTLRMLDVWNNGNFSGSYRDFVNQIKQRLPLSQQPNLDTAGPPNPYFEAEKPFTVLTNGRIVTPANGNPCKTSEQYRVREPLAALFVPGLENPDDVRIFGNRPFSASREQAVVGTLTRTGVGTVPGLENYDQVRRVGNGYKPSPRDAMTLRGPGPLRDLIMGIDKISVPFESDIASGVGESHFEYESGRRYQVTATPRRAVNTFESLAAFDVHADVLWPGSMVQGRSLPGAVLQPIALQRAPGSIVLTNLMTTGISGTYVADIASPSLGRVQQSIQNLLAQEFENDTPAKISFYMKQFYSLEHAMMQIGASYSWLSGSARAELQSSSYSELSNYVVRFVQAYYSVSFEPPVTPESLFAPEVTLEDASLYIGKDNPPTYISTVTYGRMLLVFASTRAEAESLRLALSASFSGMVSSGQINITNEQKKVLQESEIKILALGGPSSGVVKLLSNGDKAKGLEEYLKEGQNFTRDSPGVPIAYMARYLRDNDVARVSFTTNYEVRTKFPRPIMITALQLRFHTHDDDKDPDARIIVEVRAGGNVVFRGDFGKHQRWNDHSDAPNSWDAPWKLNLTKHVSLEEVRSMTLHGEQADDNSGWNMSYDVWAICDDGSNPHVGGGGVRRIGDDASRYWSDAFSGH